MIANFVPGDRVSFATGAVDAQGKPVVRTGRLIGFGPMGVCVEVADGTDYIVDASKLRPA